MVAAPDRVPLRALRTAAQSAADKALTIILDNSKAFPSHGAVAATLKSEAFFVHPYIFLGAGAQ
jgi:hypothetical protein